MHRLEWLRLHASEYWALETCVMQGNAYLALEAIFYRLLQERKLSRLQSLRMLSPKLEHNIPIMPFSSLRLEKNPTMLPAAANPPAMSSCKESRSMFSGKQSNEDDKNHTISTEQSIDDQTTLKVVTGRGRGSPENISRSPSVLRYCNCFVYEHWLFL